MPADDRYLAWIAKGIEDALKADDGVGDVRRAKRWLSKLWEVSTCMYCHEPLGKRDNDGNIEKSFRSHFKGFVHDECGDKYSGRLDYERQHGIDSFR